MHATHDTRERLDTKPWYRQFWPWFLISLPLSAVIAGFITLHLALDTDDGLVSDDYYKDGLAINKDLAKDERARTLGLEAHARFDPVSHHMEVTLHQRAGAPIGALVLQLIHPTRAHHDMKMPMEALGQGRFRATLPDPIPPANWHIRLSPPDDSWRLENRLKLPGADSVLLRSK